MSTAIFKLPKTMNVPYFLPCVHVCIVYTSSGLNGMGETVVGGVNPPL